MSSLLRGSKKLIFGLGLAGCGAAAAVLFGLSDESRVAKASTFFSDNFHSLGPFGNRPPVTAGVKWDFNWDKREPDSLLKPLKGRFKADFEENSYNEKLEKAKAIATRHLILVRHGQYNLNGKTDEERYLTELGREQARLTGLRLKELGLPYNRLIQSTMTRATETAQIIAKEMSAVPVSSCNFLREGAPIKPDPPSNNWRPEPKVNRNLWPSLCFILISNLSFVYCSSSSKTAHALRPRSGGTSIGQTLRRKPTATRF